MILASGGGGGRDVHREGLFEALNVASPAAKFGACGRSVKHSSLLIASSARGNTSLAFRSLLICHPCASKVDTF